MTHILHLDASARGSSSHSRQVSGELVQALVDAHPGATVTNRDLGHQDVPYVTEEFIGAMYTPAESRSDLQKEVLALSDELIAELKAADIIVAGVPMYNFSVPGVFKSYIDQVVRAGETFNPANYTGLLPNKKIVFVTARGGSGYGPGEPREAYNAQDPALRSAFGLMGVTDQTFIHIENTARGEDVTNGSLAAARAKVKEVVAASVK
jgi:FMN-dependent NADH-azoreductase